MNIKISNFCTIKRNVIFFIALFLLSLPYLNSKAGNYENDSLKCRKNILIYPSIAAYSITMYGLYDLWYKDYPKASFHFFNDNAGWHHIDKIGHATTAFHVGYTGINACRWAGYSEKKSIWVGGLSGLFFLTSIEIFDGFSKEWGFSNGDILANTIGASLLISQGIAFRNIFITPKISYHNTKYAQYAPDKLGKNGLERMIKDYNGQTYWLSVNIKQIAFQHTKFPEWLCISFGYGADGMITGYGNPDTYNGKALPHFDEYTQFYISTDIDLRKIKTRNKIVNTIKNAIGFIKIPLPTVEFNSNSKTKYYLFFN